MSSNNCKRRVMGAGAVLGGLLVSMAAAADPQRWQLNMPKGVTPVSHQIWDLHMAALWVCVALGIIVFGVMFVAMFRFRKSRGAVPETWTHNSKVEFAWTVIPVLILIGLAAPATIITRNMYNATDAQMTVKVTGYQWLWRYDYISYDGKPITKVPTIWSRLAWDSNAARQLGSDIDPNSLVAKDGFHDYLLNVTHPLVIPAGVKVRFLITGADVIHGWWVPDFAAKRDAIPGIMNDTWAKVDKPGVYRGQCYVLCGQDHSAMPVVVKVLPRDQFNAWLAAQEDAATLDKAARTAQAAPPRPAPPKG
ncbi:MAG TPA: cytochrome c oxidase subunit II [Rhodanobacteraceae bacterium]|jgi:cytochrome c oxidase subunit 2|nr:cytochrome c oxidase subunit II [Rhodanobacteraceae bacterium]